MRAAREAVKVEKADGLVQLVSDVGRVQTKAGTQAALDGLKLAESPREMARVAALAEKKGGKTRAILKTLGRGAILLSVASFNLAAWVLGAILTLFGFVSSAKAAVERADASATSTARRNASARTPCCAAMADRQRGLEPARVPGLYLSRMPIFHHGPVEIAYLDEGAGRADRAGARLCLHQGGELGAARLGRDAQAAPAAA